MEHLRIGFVGTYPPTHCGLATFSAALLDATTPPGSGVSGGVVRVMEGPEPGPPPGSEVVAEWLFNDAGSMWAAEAALDGFDVAIVQHEYGIYPGDSGRDVVGFLRRRRIPAIVVLHTVLSEPTRRQREVLDAVIDTADLVVVPTDAARRRLLAVHGVDVDKVAVVPHGASLGASNLPVLRRKDPVVLTWGLIGPGKGLEHGIESMGDLADLDPAPLYVIAGQTHPKVALHQGERYREGLMKAAVELGVADRVVFEDRYLDRASLARLVASADAVLLPYESREQICSGVLVEAVAAGVPVVATAFPHAVELLSSACGIVVPHDDPTAISVALRRLLTDDALATSLRDQAAREGRKLSWPAVGRAYLRLIREVIAARVAA